MNATRYNKCVEDNADGLFRFALNMVRQYASAEDIVQESFAKLWENRKKVEDGKEKSYLFTIAYRLAISELRTRKRRTQEELRIDQYATDKCYDNMTELLWKAMDSLNETARSTLVLCDWEGYSYNEIAEIMQISLPQVKITIHRSRMAIKEKLEHEYRA